jgi:CRISPR/Cas system-associated exonuclease Cas4 (RecB family)
MTRSKSPNFDIAPPDEPRNSRPHISHSQVEMYKRCSWQYYLRYVMGKKERPKLAMEIGKGAHTALERDARIKIRTGADMPINDLRDLTSDLMDAHIDAIDPSDLASEDPGKAKDDTIASVTLFRVKQAPKISPIAVEFEFNLDIAASEELEYPIRIVNGKIDVLEAMAGGVAIKDYKVTSKRKSQPEVDLSSQLDLYDEVYHAATGSYAREVGLRQFLPSNRTEPARAEQILRSPDRLTEQYRAGRRDRLIHVYQSTEKAIQTGIFIPADDPKICSWCGFREQCQFSLVKDDYQAARARTAV